MNLSEKHILVTGGSSGLGREIVDHLVLKKSHVTVFDIDDARNQELRSRHRSVNAVLCDVANADQVCRKVNDVYNQYGRIDGLVNNAGIIYNEPLVNLLSADRVHSIDGWENTLKVNLTSVFLMTANVVEKMIVERTKGVVVNISSISSRGNPGQSAYSAAKAGVNALTSTWAKELGVFGIRFIAISPGFIETASTHRAISESSLRELKSEIPLGRLGKASQIAESVLHAFQCDYINGKIMEVDGGLVL